mgnify:CR=1 FL=1
MGTTYRTVNGKRRHVIARTMSPPIFLTFLAIFSDELTSFLSKNTLKIAQKIRPYWARKCCKSGVYKFLGIPLMALQLVIFDWSLLFGMLKNVSWICFVNLNLHFLLGGLVYVDKVARDKIFHDFAGGGARATVTGRSITFGLITWGILATPLLEVFKHNYTRVV